MWTQRRSEAGAPAAVASEQGGARTGDTNGPTSPQTARRSDRGVSLRDVQLLAGFTVLAFVLRFFSPLMPDFVAHPFSGSPISNCVHATPIDPEGRTGTLCGLSYPYNKGSYNSSTRAYEPPAGEVFDEIYFARFPYYDLKGISYFDDKPPVGKLMVAAGEWTWGWFRATFQGARGSYADLGYTTFGWRLVPCIVGTLLVPLMYLVALQLWKSRTFAALAACFTCFDGMFFVQSRIAMLDIFMAFFITLAYWFFLLHRSSRSPMRALATLFLTGAALGLAIATKWSALAAWGVIGLLLVAVPLYHALARRGPSDDVAQGSQNLWQRIRLVLPANVDPVLYVATMAVAFVVVPLAIYVVSWFPFFLRGQFHSLGDIVEHDRQAYIFNATLTAGHPYGSKWYSWPFLYRPVLYYFFSGLGTDHWTASPLVAAMNDLGNPWIWWTSLPCLVALLYFVVRERSWPALVIALAFSAQYFPWARVTRVLFLFEMGSMLPFMVLALAFVLARIADREVVLFRRSAPLAVNLRGAMYAHVVLTLAFFAYFYPLWTALPIGTHALFDPFPSGKIWFPSWI